MPRTQLPPNASGSTGCFTTCHRTAMCWLRAWAGPQKQHCRKRCRATSSPRLNWWGRTRRAADRLAEYWAKYGNFGCGTQRDRRFCRLNGWPRRSKSATSISQSYNHTQEPQTWARETTRRRTTRRTRSPSRTRRSPPPRNSDGGRRGADYCPASATGQPRSLACMTATLPM